MKKFKNKATLLKEVAFLISEGKNCFYRETTETDGFIGWILFFV